MPRKETSSGDPRLERSCGARGRDWVRCGRAAGGIQALSAWFAGAAFARHGADLSIPAQIEEMAAAAEHRLGASR